MSGHDPMTADPLPIPPQILQRLLAFLRAGRTGQFVLNINTGRILNAEITERVISSGKDATSGVESH